MNRDYLINRMKLTNAAVLEMVVDLPDSFAPDQTELIESIEYILLAAHSQIEEKIAEYSLKSA